MFLFPFLFLVLFLFFQPALSIPLFYQNCTLDGICFSRHCQSATVGPIHFVVTSLLTDERAKIVSKNRELLPNLEVWRAVNGYNINETMGAFAEAVGEGLKYHWLQFETFGTLAIWLTKRAALQTQVRLLSFSFECDLDFSF